MSGNGFDYDAIVIGSGFGGSVAALHATEKLDREGALAVYRCAAPSH